ncbi:MAG: flagellar basal body P-ring formation chaperone FlgA, partial [Bdellovibrionota bacterium]
KQVSMTVYDQLDKISLGSAPALGEQRIYSSSVIAQALRSTTELASLKFVIPNEVKVDNRGYELNEEVVKSDLLNVWKDQCADCELSIKRIALPVLPADLKDRPWRLETDGRLPKGNFSSKFFVSKASGEEVLFWLSGQLEIKKLVPVLNRALQMGQRIGGEDYRWEWRDVTMATDGFPSEKNIEGQKMRLTANAGDILFFQTIAREKAVARGEVVRVHVGESEWQVSLEAVTEQDGYVGDTVNLRNRSTNRVISGEVIARGEVRIR